VLGRTRWRVGAWQAEDDDFFALDEVSDLERVRTERAAFGFRLDELGQGAFWQLVADFDGHAGLRECCFW
jgi:hypothetical protein